MTTTNALLDLTRKFARSGPLSTILLTMVTLFLLVQTGSAQLNTLDVSAPTRNQVTPSQFTIPITTSDLTTQGVIAFQFNIFYDPAVLAPVGTNFGCLTDGTLSGAAGMVAVCNVVPAGVLRVAVYGAYPMAGSGTVLNVRFQTAVNARPGDVSDLTFENLYFFNQFGYVPTNATNGRITLTRALITRSQRPTDVDLSLPPVIQTADSSFVAPVRADMPAGNAFTAFQFDVVYDPTLIRPIGPNFGCSTEGLNGDAGLVTMCTVMSEGVLRVAGFSAYPISRTGTLLNLTFAVADTDSIQNISRLGLEHARLFGMSRNATVSVHDGQVAIVRSALPKP